MKKQVTVYADGEHEVFNTETGEIHCSDSETLVLGCILVLRLSGSSPSLAFWE